MIPPIFCHDRHHHEELSSREPDPSAVCPVTAFSNTETPSPTSFIPSSNNLNCQNSSCSKIFTLRYFFSPCQYKCLLIKNSVWVVIVFHALNFLFFRAKKRRGAQRPPNGLYTQCFTLGCVVYVFMWKIYAIKGEGGENTHWWQENLDTKLIPQSHSSSGRLYG